MGQLEDEGNLKVGFGLFAGGLGFALLGLILLVIGFTLTGGEGWAFYDWTEPAYTLGFLAVPMLFMGLVVLLPPDRRFIGLAALGGVFTVLATAGFVYAFPLNWNGVGNDYTLQVAIPYALGLGLQTVGIGFSLRRHAPTLYRTVTEIHQSSSTSGTDSSSGTGFSLGDETGSSSTASSSSGTVDSSSNTGTGFNTDTGSNTGPTNDTGNIAETTDDTDSDAGFETGTVEEEDTRVQMDTDSGPVTGEEEPITLVISGEPYTFGDGDTFGRRDEPWLDDLMAASDGHEEIPYVSSDHVEFSVEDDGMYVTDQSRNGTSLNGRELDGDTAELSDGDTLVLADRAKVTVEL